MPETPEVALPACAHDLRLAGEELANVVDAQGDPACRSLLAAWRKAEDAYDQHHLTGTEYAARGWEFGRQYWGIGLCVSVRPVRLIAALGPFTASYGRLVPR